MGFIAQIHPGHAIRQECLEPHGLSVTDAAQILGVSRQALSNLLTGKAGVSPEMAIRLDLVFGGGAEPWLQRQLAYDLAEARARVQDIRVYSLAQSPAQHLQPKLL